MGKNGETPEKEEVEVEEKKDESNEKETKDDKKKKKEKKVKVPKVPKPKGPSCVETLSSGLDMTARDKDGINVEIDLSILWAVIFAIFTIFYVWLARPLIKILEVVLAVFKRVWTSALSATVEPLCASVGAFWSARSSQNLVESA